MASESTVALRAILRDDISAALGNIRKEIQQTGDTSSSVAKGGLGQLGDATAKLKEGMANAAGEIPGLSSAFGKLQSVAETLSNPIIAIPAALVAGGVAALSFARSNAELVTEMAHLSDKTGISVNALMALKKAGDPLGISIDSIAMASSRLSLNIAKNGKEFQRLKIDSNDPIEAMAEVADKFAKTESAAERARIGTAAFGRGWKELAPMLAEGGDSIRKAMESSIMTTGMVDRYKDIHEKTVEIEKGWGKVKSAIGDVASGPLQDMLTVMAKIVRYETSWVADFRKARGEAANMSQTEDLLAKYMHKSIVSAGDKNLPNQKRVLSTLDQAGFLAEVKKMSIEEQQKIIDGLMHLEKSNASARLRGLFDERGMVRGLDVKALGKFMHASNDAAAAAKEAPPDDEANDAAKEKKSAVDSMRAALAGKEAMIAAEKTYQMTLATLKDAGINEQVAAVSAGADKQITEMKAGYAKMLAVKGISRADIARIERAESAEEESIRKKASEKIQAIYKKEENQRVIQEAKDYKSLQEALERNRKETEAAEKKLAESKEKIRKIEEDREREHWQKIVTIANSAAQPLEAGFQTFYSGILNGNLSLEASFTSLADSFKSMLAQMAAELTAKAAIFGILNVATGGGAGLFSDFLGSGTLGSAASLLGFAGGGVQFGNAIVGERRAEVSTPTVPQRITQTSQSTVHNSYGGATFVINTGASVDRVAAVTVRATTRQARGMVRSSR